jgi:hypothetical protein
MAEALLAAKELEGCLIELVMGYAHCLPWYQERLREKILERDSLRCLWESVPSEGLLPLLATVVECSLGDLQVFLGVLLKYGSEGQGHATEVSALRGEAFRCQREELQKSLDRLRILRNNLMHFEQKAWEDQSEQARECAREFLKEALKALDDGGLEDILPETAIVIRKVEDGWGTHVDVVSDRSEQIICYCVDHKVIDLGRRLYLFRKTNPNAYAPRFATAADLLARSRAE